MRVFELDDVIRMLRFEVDQAGGQLAWAKKAGVHRVTVNKVLQGRRLPTKEIVNGLNLRPVFAAERGLSPSSSEGSFVQPLSNEGGGNRPRFGRTKRTALYLRITRTEKSTRKQRLKLQALANRRGWRIVHVFEDGGYRSAEDWSCQPELDALLRAVEQGKVDMVAAWSVDQLGRSLTAVLHLLRALRSKGTDLFLLQHGLDTSRRAGRAVFESLDTFDEFERALISARVLKGVAGARWNRQRLGRPRIEDVSPRKAEHVRELRAKGFTVRQITADVGLSMMTVLRLIKPPTLLKEAFPTGQSTRPVPRERKWDPGPLLR